MADLPPLGDPLIGGPLPPAKADLYDPEALPSQAHKFWAPPDEPSDEPYDIEVLGATIVRAETKAGSKMVVFSAVVSAQEKLTLLRFRVPSHKRACRKFYKAGKFKRGVPRTTGETTVKGGAFFVIVEGTVIGEDTLPEGVGENVARALVLDPAYMKLILA